MNMPDSSQMQIVLEFAKASEELNAFARSLRERGIDVSTGADIRLYQDGPKLEKWIEVKLKDAEPVFCWWLELGYIEGDALISANVSGSNGDCYYELDSRRASNASEVLSALNDAVAWLKVQDFDGRVAQ